MSVRHLDKLLAPRSVAVVGVSSRPGSLGAIVLRNLRAAGFAGPPWAVNKRAGEVGGMLVLALDTRIRVRRPRPGEGNRLALRPYPSELEEGWVIGGRKLQVRPIRPEDGDRLAAFYAQASPADLRLRFFMARREVPRSELARYCQIDYEREMTFVALDREHMAGEVRAVCDPDNREAEFAIQVAGTWQRRGLGRKLLGKLLAYLRARGTAEVVGACLQENAGLLALARSYGFEVKNAPDETMKLRLVLGAR
jgi:acetyltransferase